MYISMIITSILTATVSKIIKIACIVELIRTARVLLLTVLLLGNIT